MMTGPTNEHGLRSTPGLRSCAAIATPNDLRVAYGAASLTATDGTTASSGMDAPGPSRGRHRDTWAVSSRRDHRRGTAARSGISTVLWTTGYAPEYDWLDLPILDEFGVPRHVRGISEVPGLSLIGLLWQHNNGSANLGGVAVDAAYLASQW